MLLWYNQLLNTFKRILKQILMISIGYQPYQLFQHKRIYLLSTLNHRKSNTRTVTTTKNTRKNVTKCSHQKHTRFDNTQSFLANLDSTNESEKMLRKTQFRLLLIVYGIEVATLKIEDVYTFSVCVFVWFVSLCLDSLIFNYL